MFADDYVTSYNSWKTEKEQWFQQKENEITEIKLKYEQRMTDLENIYAIWAMRQKNVELLLLLIQEITVSNLHKMLHLRFAEWV
mgnify:CR=1 FL=1